MILAIALASAVLTICVAALAAAYLDSPDSRT
jgi:hypothetical protein